MSFKSLTPYQVEALTNPRKQAKKQKRKRANGLSCYVPLGDSQASRRMTGVHLEPDSDEMVAAAVHFASGLIQAIEGGQGDFRSIIGPARYGDKVLAIYCGMLIKGALGKPQDIATYGSVSPALVPYLLGGVTNKTAEELCYRALEVMDFFPDAAKPLTMQKALANVGFGPGIRHEKVGTDLGKKYNHISLRQDFLLNLPRGVSYARLLIREGAYGEALHRLLMSWKDRIIEEVELLLDPATGEMTELAAVGRHRVVLNDMNYDRAIRKVFEQDWKDLDLSTLPEHGVADGEVLMARKIIQRISYNDRMSAEALVGISLLTGLSVANWTSFAVEDLKRRGETFITADEIDRAIEMIEVSPHFKCEQELRGHSLLIRTASRAPAKWARRLQSGYWPLWSTKGQFYLIRYTGEGIPQYKSKPVPLSSEK